jgi:nicotinamidase-related amidase
MSYMPQNTALLVMDMQNGIVNGLENKDSIIEANQRAIEKARQQDIPVIFVRVAFSQGLLEIAPNNKMFGPMREKQAPMEKDSEATQIHPELNRQEQEPIVTKHRVSAFTGSNLEVLLRGLEVRHIVLTGVATSGVVLSTSVEAADKDFDITILEDAVGDREQDKHEFLVERILPRYATITSVENW